MKSGIYKIINIINNKAHIGQSSNIPKRWKLHKYTLRNNIHKNPHFNALDDESVCITRVVK